MEKNLAQRIIFTGPAGVKKKGVIDKLIEEFLSHKNAKKEEENRYFRRLSIEEEIKEKLDAKHILTFLSEKKYNQQQQIWKQAFDQLRKKVEETPSNIHLLIEFHSCYFLGQKRLPFWSFPEIDSLHPSIFITLLDDSYSIWHRIHMEEAKKPVGSYLRLQDIVEWRRTEVLLTDLMANSLKLRNFIVPVKHPHQMLYRLLFRQPENPLIYISYPITSPREMKGEKEIDEHRYKIHSFSCVAFDPLSIDERALQSAFLREFGKDALNRPPKLTEKEVALEKKDRWPLKSHTFLPMVPDHHEIFPLKLPASEVYAVLQRPQLGYGRQKSEEKSLVDTQIEERDFRYIRDCDLVVAYRPYWKGKRSKGVCAEIDYARGFRPIIVYHPRKDNPSRSIPDISPFDNDLGGVGLCDDKEGFYNSVTSHIKSLIKSGGDQNEK